MTPQAFAAQCVAICSAGFTSEFHWINWKKKHAKEIAELPIRLRTQVLLAWTNATCREFSQRSAPAVNPDPPSGYGGARSEEKP